jgi:uroporphyrinogen-III synthase
LQNLQLLISQLDVAQQQKVSAFLQNGVLQVPSQRLVAVAQAAGFNQIICAENATDNAMTAALLNYCRTHECISLQD